MLFDISTFRTHSIWASHALCDPNDAIPPNGPTFSSNKLHDKRSAVATVLAKSRLTGAIPWSRLCAEGFLVIPTACPTESKLPDRLILGAAKWDRFGDDADGKVVSFPFGMGERIGSVLTRLLDGSWDKIVCIVFRTNCWRVMRWEDDMSTTWRSVLRRKIEYASAWTTSILNNAIVLTYRHLSFHSQDYIHTISWQDFRVVDQAVVILLWVEVGHIIVLP